MRAVKTSAFRCLALALVLAWSLPSNASPDAPTLQSSATRLEHLQTLQMINRQAQTLEGLQQGRERARAMFSMLRKSELEKPSERLSERGNQILRNNPELQTPVAIISTGAMLWMGRTLSILKNEAISLSSYIEARARSASLNLSSALLNSQIRYDQGNGLNLGMNRNLEELSSSAEVSMNFKTQTILTQVSHHLANHIAISVGAVQTLQSTASEKVAQFQYQTTF